MKVNLCQTQVVPQKQNPKHDFISLNGGNGEENKWR